MREPAPLACRAAAAYAAGGAGGADAARREWESEFEYEKEDREPEHRLVLGGVLPFAELLAVPARPGEPGPDWETSRFGRWSRRLWDPLLAREELTER